MNRYRQVGSAGVPAEQEITFVRASDIGTFDILKIGIGPSSSHTMGPMLAAGRFREILAGEPAVPASLRVLLFGSLAATGRGHRTDEAVCAGLVGLDPMRSPVEDIWRARSAIEARGGFDLANRFIPFQPARDIEWHVDPPPGEKLDHPNTLRFVAGDAAGRLCALTARSVGGGFVEFDRAAGLSVAMPIELPCPFDTAAELVAICEQRGWSVVQVALANEAARGPAESEVRVRLLRIWEVMQDSIEAGLTAEGVLPGGLNVRRRSQRLYSQSHSDRLPLARHADLRASAYAMAVAENNAGGGRIVTAPTNGAAGVLPAVLREVSKEQLLSEREIQDGLLIAAVIGALVKRGASISGAEIGCQGEIGTACAMAAAAAVGMLGGNVRQIEDAAEIAIEHHLGLTCDPVRGLVQIPCIERNAMGAIKALNAAAMALASDGSHLVSLDRALAVMKQTGLDMKDRYRETATGGLGIG